MNFITSFSLFLTMIKLYEAPQIRRNISNLCADGEFIYFLEQLTVSQRPRGLLAFPDGGIVRKVSDQISLFRYNHQNILLPVEQLVSFPAKGQMDSRNNAIGSCNQGAVNFVVSGMAKGMIFKYLLADQSLHEISGAYPLRKRDLVPADWKVERHRCPGVEVKMGTGSGLPKCLDLSLEWFHRQH